MDEAVMILCRSFTQTWLPQLFTFQALCPIEENFIYVFIDSTIHAPSRPTNLFEDTSQSIVSRPPLREKQSTHSMMTRAATAKLLEQMKRKYPNTDGSIIQPSLD